MRTPTTRFDPALARPYAPTESEPGWLEWINRFWFAPADPTALGLMRICTGIIVVYMHLVYVMGLPSYFGENAWVDLKIANQFRREVPVVNSPFDWGKVNEEANKPLDDPKAQEARKRYIETWNTDPVTTYHQGSYLWSLWFHITNPTWMAIVAIAMLVVMVMFTLGFCTRVTSVLTWMAAMCFIQRNWTVLYGVDSIMNVLLIYLMISPCADALSVDRWLSRWWTARRTGQKLGPAPTPAPTTWANFILRLMQIHFCIIYLASGTSKLQGTSWWNGTALWACVANYEFAPLNLALYSKFVLWLSQHRVWWEILLSSSAVFTLLLELGFPFLVWSRRLRPYMLCGAVMLHSGIAVIMGLGTFSLMMLCLLLAFVPGEAVRRAMRLAVDWLRGKDLHARPNMAPAGELALQRR
jgi:hypothetical protein